MRFNTTFTFAPLVGITLALTMVISSVTAADKVESYTRPYRSVAVSAAEVGVLSEIRVREGDHVKKGQVLAKLDDSVLVASLEVARAAKQSEGSLKAAEAEKDARLKILNSYKELRDQGNASPRECERAIDEHLKSSARLLAVREDLEVRRLEYERVKVQINQRHIKSPISGHVIQIEKEAGEFVSPTDPVVVHVVQLDSLKVVFSVPVQWRSSISAGQSIPLTVGDGKLKTTCNGKIEFVSPVAEPETGEVRVTVRILNPGSRIQSGVICRWDLSIRGGEEQLTNNATERTRQR